MKRRIIKQGHNTLTMTLPAEWVKKLNLKPGDEVDLIEKENSLLINGHERNKEKCAIIDINNFQTSLLWKFFQGAYRSGCNEIRIVFDPNKRVYEDPYHYCTFHYYTTQFYHNSDETLHKTAIEMIQSVVDRFIGMGIMETGKNYCIIREMGELTPKEFENSLRRIFLVV